MAKNRIAKIFDIESVFNAALIATAIYFVCKLGRLGLVNLKMGGAIPDSLPGLIHIINTTSAPGRVMHWAVGLFALGMASTVLLSALEGSWWLSRRIRANLEQAA